MKSISTLVVVLIVLGCSSVYATTIHIPADYETIQEGIEASNNGDTVLVAEGIYQEHLNYLGKSIIVESETGSTATIIEPQNSDQSIITFTADETRNSILSGFTIRNSANAPAVIIRNSAPSIIGNKFYDNSHSSYGGAVSSDYNSFPLIKDNLFKNNSASRGGGIDSGINGIGDILVEGNIFISNISSTHGGALFIKNASSASLVHHNVFYQNHCPELGGGMCVSTSSDVAIYNNTFSSNSNNQDHQGAGITIWYSSDCGVYNNIVVNSDGEGIFQANGFANNAYYNNCWGNSVDYYGFDPGPGSISEDPLFVGGEPFDFRLQAGSPCIDAGDPESPPDPDGSIADMGAYYYGTVLTAAIDIGDTYGENGQPVDIPLIATGLSENEIAGVELHVAYDSECLEYVGFSSDHLTDPLVNVADGVINILWEDYENPVTLPDSSSVIDLQFTVLGQIGDVCLLEWTGNNELVDPMGELIDGVSWDNGSVTVIEFHSVEGNVVYYDLLTPVAGVTIQLSGDHNLSTITDDAGAYIFETLFPGSFTLCPSRTDDDAGVTVTDIVNIRRHIVRLETFDTPYKLLAADVNISGAVSVADVIKLRRYLADLDDLPSGNWAFINSSFIIDDNNWQSAPDCIDFDLWDADLTDSSFVSVRMGDVDYSWAGDRRGRPRPSGRDFIELDLMDCLGAPGDIVRMSVNVAGFKDVAGFELHLEYPQEVMRCLGLETASMNQPTTNIADGKIHFVWEDIFHAVTLNDGREALSLLFEILDGAPDTMVISVASAHIADIEGADYDIIATDGYISQQYPTKHGNAYSIPESFNLRETYPNPFNARANIEFDIPEASYVTLAIYDLLGREIEILVDRFYPAGYHRVTWDAGARPSGLYFVRLQAGEYNADRKMLLIK